MSHRTRKTHLVACIGQNGIVPRLVHAKNPLPEEAAQAVSILGLNPLRAEVLRYLFLHPEGASTGEIGDAIGTGHRTVLNHLILLEKHGIVATRDSRERRIGKRHLYFIDSAAFDQTVANLVAHIKGTAAGDLDAPTAAPPIP